MWNDIYKESSAKFKALMIIIMSVCLAISFVIILSRSKILSQESMEIIELYSIGTDKNIEGRFVMGRGNIETKEVYTAYQIMNDGGKKYYTMDRDITTIYENLDTNATAYAEIYRKGIINAIVQIKLYVPQNTIIQEINIDL